MNRRYLRQRWYSTFKGLILPDLNVDTQIPSTASGKSTDRTLVSVAPVHLKCEATWVAVTRNMRGKEAKLLSVQAQNFDSAFVEPVVWITNEKETFANGTACNNSLAAFKCYPGDLGEKRFRLVRLL